MSIFDKDPLMRAQRDAEERVSRWLQGSITGRWHEVALVLSRRSPRERLRCNVFGCGPSVRVIGDAELDAAAAPLFALTESRRDVFHVPLYVHRDVARNGIDLNVCATTHVFDGDYHWETLFSNLEDSAAVRAQEGTGPTGHSLDYCAELMRLPGVACPGDDVDTSTQVSEAVDVVLGQARRHAAKLLDAGVILIRSSELNDRAVVKLKGDFVSREKCKRICLTGAASTAATFLMNVDTDRHHARRTTFILFVSPNAATQWTITRDPVIALRHMDATERLRLRGLGLFP